MSDEKYILIIDDSPMEVSRFESILQSKGYTTHSINNAESGIVEARNSQPDLILMDVVMGGMNGFQATRKITQQPETKDIPVIIVSTKDQATDRVWAQRQGAKAYITKPVDETLLLATIDTLLNE